jgi:hypothetical protein
VYPVAVKVQALVLSHPSVIVEKPILSVDLIKTSAKRFPIKIKIQVPIGIGNPAVHSFSFQL